MNQLFSKVKNFFLILLIVSFISYSFTPLITQAADPGAALAVPTADVYAGAVSNKEAGQSIFGVPIPFTSLDSFAYFASRLIIKRITAATVQWINNGFHGQPAFIGNPGQFFQNVGDTIAGQFIQGTDLAFLCSPFRLQIQLTLALNYSSQFSDISSCSLSGIINNTQNFANDFTQGGWQGFIAVSQNDNNNPYGSFLNANTELNVRIASAQSEEATKLDWGKGFMSLDDCTTNSTSYSYNNSTATHDCTIKTPGSVIESQLETVLGTDIRQLELAQSFNEIVSALMNQLLGQVFSSTGLSGSTQSDPGQGNTQSFADRLKSEKDHRKAGALTDLNKFDGYASATPIMTGQNGQNPGFVGGQTVTYGALVTMSKIGQDPNAIVNGDRSNSFQQQYRGAIAESATATSTPWIEIKLNQVTPLQTITIFQRTTPGPASTKIHFTVQVLDATDSNIVWESPVLYQDFGNYIQLQLPPGVSGQYIRLQGQEHGRLEIAQVEAVALNKPIINLLGDQTMIVKVGEDFSDPGASASDNKDGDISSKIIVSGDTVDKNTPTGTYTIRYNVTNSQSVPATEVDRTVIVQ